MESHQTRSLYEQYAAYRKQQGKTLLKTETLRQLNETLVSQKAVKEELLSDNRKVQEQFEQERKKQQKVLQNLRSNESKYAAQIKRNRVKR
ncbi:MAG: hypothetical protein CM15mP83_0480 [Flavobacteriaceae bacterium]|nr:MAG: hypothetical protein CM15mP83_0480 [Flavobacteriaceae bacterium]